MSLNTYDSRFASTTHIRTDEINAQYLILPITLGRLGRVLISSVHE